jgi:hypothetical protein
MVSRLSATRTTQILGLQGEPLRQWATEYIGLQLQLLAGQHDATCDVALQARPAEMQEACSCPAGVRWLDLTCKQQLVEVAGDMMVPGEARRGSRVLELAARPLQYEAALLVQDGDS